MAATRTTCLKWVQELEASGDLDDASANRGYVQFVHFICILLTFLQYVSRQVQIHVYEKAVKPLFKMVFQYVYVKQDVVTIFWGLGRTTRAKVSP